MDCAKSEKSPSLSRFRLQVIAEPDYPLDPRLSVAALALTACWICNFPFAGELLQIHLRRSGTCRLPVLWPLNHELSLRNFAPRARGRG